MIRAVHGISPGYPQLIVLDTTDERTLNDAAGHLDPGESPIEGCVRETLEETAHAFTPTTLVGIYMARSSHRTGSKEDVTYLRFAFAGTLGAQEAGRALDKGIVRTVWMSADEIRACVPRHRSPLLLQCVEDHLAGKRYPLDLIHVHESVR